MKKKLYYQQVVEKINNDTGEITTTKVIRAYKDKKESETYYKVNENFVIAILKTNITKKEISLFLLLGNYMNYGNEIVIDLKLQEQISTIMGISPKTIKNYVYSLHKKDFMIRINENRYLINPNYIGKGNGTSLENVKLLYCDLWRKQQLNSKINSSDIIEPNIDNASSDIIELNIDNASSDIIEPNIDNIENNVIDTDNINADIIGQDELNSKDNSSNEDTSLDKITKNEIDNNEYDFFKYVDETQ